MKKILEVVISNRKITIFAVVMIIVMGILNYTQLPKQEAPIIELETISLVTFYKGASVEVIDKVVTKPIENVLREIDESKEVISFSRNNVSVILFSVQTSSNGDYKDIWDKVRRKLRDVETSFPDNVGSIEMNTNLIETASFIYAVEYNDANYDSVISLLEHSKEKLLTLDGVAKVRINSASEKRVEIILNAKKMALHNLAYNDVAQIIRAQNIEIPSGKLRENGNSITIHAEGNYKYLSDIENVIIGMKTNGPIRLKDVGSVIYDDNIEDYMTYHNESKVILLSGFFSKGINVLPVGDQVEKEINSLKRNLRATTSIHELIFQPNSINKRINSFLESLLMGMLLVMVVVFLGMGAKNAFLVSITLPLSLLMSISLIKILNVEIHQISIVSFIIALGMLVDNSIVVLDAIQVRLNDSENKMYACIQGVRDVMVPVLTSTLTTICMFLPILLMKGEIGSYLRSLPLVVITSLISSYIVAILILPTLSYIFLKPAVVKQKKQKKQRLKALYTFFIRKRFFLFLIITALSIVTYLQAKDLSVKFFPYADVDMIYMNVNSNGNSDILDFKTSVLEISKTIREYDEVTEITSTVGDSLPKFYDTMSPTFPSDTFAQLLIKFDLKKIGVNKRFESVAEFKETIQQDIGSLMSDITIDTIQLEQGEPVGAPVQIDILGADLKELKIISALLEEKLKTVEGTTRVTSNIEKDNYEKLVIFDRDKLTSNGLNMYDIQLEIHSALHGVGVGEFGVNQYKILLKSDLETINDLSEVSFSSNQSQSVPFSTIAHMKKALTSPVVRKSNGQLFISVNAHVLSGYSAINITDEIMTYVDELNITSDIDVVFKGESDSISRNFTELLTIGLMFFMVIFFILLVQFNSFKGTIIVLLTIPLSTMGALIGLRVTGQNLSFTALLGMISLAGIVINNGIVILDFINVQIKDGLDVKSACIKAALRRTRPIILSSFTTIIGLLPLIFLGSELFTPMAVALASGLLVSTLLTLLLIPVLGSLLIK